MKPWAVVKWSLGVCGLWSMAGFAMASCVQSGQAFDGTLPIQIGNITVGRDVPLGAVVYRQSYNAKGSLQIACSSAPDTMSVLGNVTSAPKPLSTWSSAPYAGKVYETGVPGLGVALTNASGNFPYVVTAGKPGCPAVAGGCTVATDAISQFDMVIIKTGEVTPGAVLASNLPTVEATMTLDGVAFEMFRVRMTGAVNVISRTCQTPDVSVDMGVHKLSEFSGLNSTTGLKTFEIKLLNCPAFQGTYQTTGPAWDETKGSATSVGAKSANTIQFRLDPTRPALSQASGIVDINPTTLGSIASAGGVGLQIIGPSNSPLPLGTYVSSGITPLAVEGAAYSIPLSAQYIQTADTVTAGQANATVTFTLEYQ